VVRKMATPERFKYSRIRGGTPSPVKCLRARSYEAQGRISTTREEKIYNSRKNEGRSLREGRTGIGVKNFCLQSYVGKAMAI